MYLGLRRRMSGRSPSRAWRSVSPASTQGYGGGLAEVTEVSSRGKYDGDGWVLTGGGVTLYWRFSDGSVSASLSSGILIL